MVRTAVLLNVATEALPTRLRLAGLPLLLRAVLAAQRGGIEEMIIVGGEDPAPLLRDKRVKPAWRWVPAPGADEIGALRAAQAEVSQDFLLLFADSIFEAGAVESLARVSVEGYAARIARRPDDPDEGEGAKFSLALCSPDLLRQLDQEPARDGRLAAVVTRLRHEGRADSVAVAGRLWPRTGEREKLRGIQRELTHFNLKPSDGIFARFNKLVVAQPLIRFFLRTPATPNFITGLGLALALASAWTFAHGSYGWSLAGAVLAYLSALLDHADGMVARLKMQESESGFWFEAAVDIASYWCVFGGLAVGLYRETGFVHHLVAGGVLLAGVGASFIAQSKQRKLVGSDNPADYPVRMHEVLDQHSHNLFHWFARKAHFMVRRAVLPYFVMLFCLLDWRVLMLDLVAIGANLFWLLTLYSSRLVRPASTASAEAD